MKSVILASTFTLLTLFGLGCATSRTTVTEERRVIPLHHLKTSGDEAQLEASDSVAMACSKCRTILWANSATSWPRGPSRPFEQRHYCPGCKSTITRVDRGLSSTEEIKHSCGACGDDSVFCCATRKGSATEGMDRR